MDKASHLQEADHRLDEYSRRMGQTIIDGPREIIFEHYFLELEEEAAMEQQSLFSNPKNLDIVRQLLESFGEDVGEELAVIVSVGTSSTQVYSKNHLLGAFYVGSTAIVDEPKLAVEMIHQIASACIEKGFLVPIIFVNSIGYLVKKNILLNDLTGDDLDEYLCDKDLLDAKLTGDTLKF